MNSRHEVCESLLTKLVSTTMKSFIFQGSLLMVSKFSFEDNEMKITQRTLDSRQMAGITCTREDNRTEMYESPW